jgi:hypothetical protein
MKFFIPDIHEEAQEKNIYKAIRLFVIETMGSKFSDRKIFRLRYNHNGKQECEEVGKLSPSTGEMVKAILYAPSRKLYNVCTNNRGVIRGIPILVGENEVIEYIDFENE